MRRPIGAYLLVFLVLLVFGTLGWLTHNPEAEILARAESWPYIGPFAERFRSAYLGPVEAPAETESEALAEAGTSPPDRVVRRHQVWLLAGQALKATPKASAETIHTFDKVTTVQRLEKRGDWYRIDSNGLSGWVHLEDYDPRAAVPYGIDAEPAIPVPPRQPDPQRLAAARKYLKGRERELLLAGYTLYTDCQDDELLAYLDAVVEPLDEIYAARYGRRPLGEPSEAIVLYRSDIAYRLLQRQSPKIAGLASAGHASEGVAVLYIAGRSRHEVAMTLVHELVHFINRRAVGPQLPPWLDEGLADGLSYARIDQYGRLFPRELGGERRRNGREINYDGGRASVLTVSDALAGGSLPTLPTLIATEWEAFVAPSAVRLNYATAAFWVRFFLDAEDRRFESAFRDFLTDVAAGREPSQANLERRLAADWQSLEIRFSEWIGELALEAKEPDGDEPAQ